MNTIDEEIRARVMDRHTTSLKLSDLREITRRILSASPIAGDDS